MPKRLLILSVAALFLLGACGDDDDDGGTLGFPGQGGTTQPGQVPGANGDPGQVPGAGGGSGSGGYDEAMQADFVNECANFPGSSAPVCECAWGQITSSVPFEEYQAFATGFAQGSTELPEWLTSAVSSCA